MVYFASVMVKKNRDSNDLAKFAKIELIEGKSLVVVNKERSGDQIVVDGGNIPEMEVKISCGEIGSGSGIVIRRNFPNGGGEIGCEVWRPRSEIKRKKAPEPRISSQESSVHQSPRGIFICQSQYTMDLLKKHGMEKFDAISTPMATVKLDADLQDADLARCNDDCKSTSGDSQFLGDKLVQRIENKAKTVYEVLC
ncbi:retrovirus-related pol polyprotein from transposon TNT 1-94, partial [Tanacetum coccineum]